MGMNTSDRNRLEWSLLGLRLGVFAVMFVWTLDKFANPQHATAVFENFYGLAGLGRPVFLAVGVAELILVIAFVAGLWKRWTYGAVLVLHAISTFSSWRQYLAPFDHLLFFAAWPMLAACLALYLLRDHDRRWILGGAEREPR